MAIGSEQILADALRRITETAADLVDARYAALGVLDESGSRLAEFITVGLDDEETRRIGARPEGHGILGLLILDPQPLRLPDLHAHPDSFGFPPGHPPMTSFLGVPIRLRGVVYGNLYLTDKADGEVFTDVDQELVVGLAAAAGLAIENARLHEQAGTRRAARPSASGSPGISTTTSSSACSPPGCRCRRRPSGVDGAGRRRADHPCRRRSRRVDPSDPLDDLRAPPAVVGRRTSLRGDDPRRLRRSGARRSGSDRRATSRADRQRRRSNRIGSHLLLCLREALSNVARHASASSRPGRRRRRCVAARPRRRRRRHRVPVDDRATVERARQHAGPGGGPGRFVLDRSG